MIERCYTIRGIDPLLFRDGRPFTTAPADSSAHTLPLPLPGTLAGFLRTQLGNKAGWNWKADGPAKALATEVHAPLLVRNNDVVFRAPADSIVYAHEIANNNSKHASEVMCLRPLNNTSDGAGCDLPDRQLIPLCVTRSAKPETGFKYWPSAYMENWLCEADPEGKPVPEPIGELPTDERTHVAIMSETGKAEDGKLFTTRMLGFETHPNDFNANGGSESEACWLLLARVRTPEDIDLTGPGLLGGERRIATVGSIATAEWPACPKEIEQVVAVAERVRMILATPAIFTNGWAPAWLDSQRIGSPPSCPDVQLKLVSAAVPRREPVSGWDFTKGPHGEAKPIRWMVPAGAVYFFEVVGGEASSLAQGGWLEAVSDNVQDRRDGYGLALWGVWDYAGQKDNV